ncbi:MAG: hypothetical protein FWH01_11550 [Oscillospiraceae bacterium]|nr:hypothetical protein [Oscillospiraceae bacterium]
MRQQLDLTLFAPRDFLRCTQAPGRIDAVVLDDTRGSFSISGADGAIGGLDWSSYKGFYFDIHVNAPHNGRFMMAFWRTGKQMGEAPDVTCVFGALPGCTTRIWFDLSWLDGQNVHITRTPGRLKMGLSASTRFNIKDMGSFAFSVWNSPTAYGFTLENFTLSSKEPEFACEDRRLVDEMGQWMGKDWPGKTHSVDELVANLRRRYEEASAEPPQWGVEGWNKWGGLASKKLTDGSGWFATKHDGKRWWLVDPDGYAFISVGPDCVGATNQWTPIDPMKQHMSWLPGADDPVFADARNERFSHRRANAEAVNFEIANLIRAFGGDWLQKYAVIVKRDMMKMGFNTVANWSVPELYKIMRMPYFIPMSFYPRTEKTIFRSFPDVYSDEFTQKSVEYARHLEQYKDDPYLVGYFMTNEPDWAYIQDLNVAEQLLACPHDLASKGALINWLSGKYGGDIAALNRAWNIEWGSFEDARKPVREAAGFSAAAKADLVEFTRILIRRYTEIPALECRKVDPNHLNVGMRYASISSPDVIEGWDLFDVYSINNYRMCPVEEINRIAQFIDRPILIGEFHFGALDVGMPATGLRGVTSQFERGVAYAYYVENAAAHPSMVGAHFFVLEDQNALGRSDGENLNIGVMDVCLTIYEDFAEGIKLTHSHLYDVAAAKLMPTRRAAREIPMIFS